MEEEELRKLNSSIPENIGYQLSEKEWNRYNSYKITDPNFYEELEFCKDCNHYGEPNGCNRDSGCCDAYTIFVAAYGQLRKYECTDMTPEDIIAIREKVSDALKILEKANEECIFEDDNYWVYPVLHDAISTISMGHRF